MSWERWICSHIHTPFSWPQIVIILSSTSRLCWVRNVFWHVATCQSFLRCGSVTFHTSWDTTEVTKTNGIRWDGNAARIKKVRNTKFGRKAKGRRSLVRPGRWLEENIQTNLMSGVWECGLGSSGVGQKAVAVSSEDGDEPSGPQEARNHLACQFLDKNPAARCWLRDKPDVWELSRNWRQDNFVT
jgi:hypothetical protein